MPLFFWFDHSLGARAKFVNCFVGKEKYSEIVWPLNQEKFHGEFFEDIVESLSDTVTEKKFNRTTTRVKFIDKLNIIN